MSLQYDLTLTNSRYLDRHLVFPLLEFLGSRQLYDAAEIEAAKLALIEKTNMVDYAVDIYQQLHQTDEVGAGARVMASRAACREPARGARPPREGPRSTVEGGSSQHARRGQRAGAGTPRADGGAARRAAHARCPAAAAPCTPRAALAASVWAPTCPTPHQVPDSLVARRRDVVAKLRALESSVRPVTDFLSNEENVKLLKQDKTQNQAFLQREFGIGEEAVGEWRRGRRRGGGRGGRCVLVGPRAAAVLGQRAPAPLLTPLASLPPPPSCPAQALSRWRASTTLQSGTLSAATTARRQSTSTTTAPSPPTQSARCRGCGARSPRTCCCRQAGWVVGGRVVVGCTPSHSCGGVGACLGGGVTGSLRRPRRPPSPPPSPLAPPPPLPPPGRTLTLQWRTFSS